MRIGFRSLFILVLFFTSWSLADEARLLRFPATNGTDIVFTHAGDLYSVPMTGGVARKLTSHDGYEMFPRFSADGQWLAFTGQYDGNTEVYVMPAAGGVPKRLTYTATLGRDDVADRMGPNNLVMTWKNTTNEIVFRSRMRSFNSFIGQLYSVGMDAGLPDQLPVPRGGFLSYSPDDKQMAYNQVFREFRTWKRYRGGRAQEIWLFDRDSGISRQLTRNPATDNQPVWVGERIYFTSDRDYQLDLYAMGPDGGEPTQVTDLPDFDVLWPSGGPDAVVFEQAGALWLHQPSSGQTRQVVV
ncbi:MAG: PD40 domain-containing protein, partial [Verrucomicrobiae bacterium]|nr:PD40 domain-containing protein [Verrucomicrobiae bacterium]